MKGDNQNERAQMILLAGFLIAVILISLATVVGSSFYSQSSPDDSGVSSLTTQVTDQVESAVATGQESASFVSETSIEEEGKNTSEVEEALDNITEEQELLAEELAEDELLLNITLLEVSELSWLIGQSGDGIIPGIVREDPEEAEEIDGDLDGEFEIEVRQPADVSFAIDTTGSMGVVYDSWGFNPRVSYPDTGRTDGLSGIDSSIAYWEHDDVPPHPPGHLPGGSSFSNVTPLSEYDDRFDEQWQTAPTSQGNVDITQGNPVANNFPNKADWCYIEKEDTGEPLPVGGTGTSDDWCEPRIGDVPDQSDVNNGDVLWYEPSDAWVEVTNSNPGNQDQVIVTDGAGYNGPLDLDDLRFVEYRMWVADRIYLTQEETKNSLDTLEDEDRVSLIEYNNNFWGDATTVDSLDGPLLGDQRWNLKEEVDELTPTSGTNISAGIVEATEDMVDAPDEEGLSVSDLEIELPPDGNGAIEIEVADVTVEEVDGELNVTDVTLGNSQVVGSVDYEELALEVFEEIDGPGDPRLNDAADELEDALPEAAVPDASAVAEELAAQTEEDDLTRARHMIAHTDGFNSDVADDPRTVNAAEKAWEDHGIRVHTMALGEAANEDLMDETADAGNGLFVAPGADPDEVNDLFEDLVDEIQGGGDDDFSLDVDLDLNVTVETEADSGNLAEMYSFDMDLQEFERDDGSFKAQITDNNGDRIWSLLMENTPDEGYNLTVNDDEGSILDNEDVDPDEVSVDDGKLIIEENLSSPDSSVQFDMFGEPDGTFEIEVGGETVDIDGVDSNELISRDNLVDATDGTDHGSSVEFSEPASVQFNNSANASGPYNLDVRPFNDDFDEFEEGEAFEVPVDGCEDGLCGLNNTSGPDGPEAYSTAQVKKAEFEITVETPDGIDTRIIEIDISDLSDIIDEAT